MEKFAALNRAKEDEGYAPDGYWGADSPKCPHCGHVCDISEEGWYDLYDEGEHEKSCPSCDGDFTIRSEAKYSFSTDEQEDLDDDDA